MPRYLWEGRSASGASVRGEMEAPAREAVLQSLRSSRITVVRIEERAGGPEDYTAVASAPPARGRRPGDSLRDKLFYLGVAAIGAAISVGVGYLDPIHDYDCARQPDASVNCTVHRRVHGLVPLGDLRFSRIESAQIKIGGQQDSWEALVLVCADGTRWQSPKTSWPLGRAPSDLREGIQQLLNARSPETYRAWAGDKVTLSVALAFLAPAGLILLGGLLRLVIPRSFVERQLSALQNRRRRT